MECSWQVILTFCEERPLEFTINLHFFTIRLWNTKLLIKCYQNYPPYFVLSQACLLFLVPHFENQVIVILFLTVQIYCSKKQPKFVSESLSWKGTYSEMSISVQCWERNFGNGKKLRETKEWRREYLATAYWRRVITEIWCGIFGQVKEMVAL